MYGASSKVIRVALISASAVACDIRAHVKAAADKLRASPSDIAGLWNVPGYPELTTGQLLDLARQS